MKLLGSLVLLANVLVCLCYVKPFIQRRPKPMKNFIPEKAAGKWYFVAKYISCKFQGVRDFTDHTRTNVYDPEKKQYRTRFDYRVGPKCYSLEDVRAIHDNCAVQFAKDRIGGSYSGERVVVATDYKHFMIEWGCLEYSQADQTICLDIIMNVMTRTPKPSKRTLVVIDTIMKKLFNSVVTDLDLTTHENPC